MSHHPFGGFDDEIAIAADVLLRSWWRLLSERDPWRDTPLDDSLGMMRRVLSELLNEARDCDRRGRIARMTVAARAHGAFRHAQRYSPRNVYEEFDFLLPAAEAVMTEQGLSPEFVTDAIAILESEVGIALDSALDGWMGSVPPRPPGSP